MSEIYDIPDAFLSDLLLYTELVYEDRTSVAFESHLYGGAMLELFQEMYCVLCTEMLSHDHIVLWGDTTKSFYCHQWRLLLNITSCSLTFTRCHPFTQIYESLIVFVIVIISVRSSFRSFMVNWTCHIVTYVQGSLF